MNQLTTPRRDKIYYIYVLKCEHDTIYVGKTTNVWKRLQQHFFGEEKRAVEWLKIHKPKNVEAVYNNKTAEHEDFYTERYIRLYGPENVRGGSYVCVNLPEYQTKTLETKRRCVADACFKCGGDHFAKDCKIIPSETEEEKILKVVKVLNGTCGRNYIANVLVDEEVKPKHYNIIERGIGKGRSKGEWISMIDSMLSTGKLRIIHKGMYPMVSLPGDHTGEKKVRRRNSKIQTVIPVPNPTPTPIAPSQEEVPAQTFFSTIGRFFGY